MEFNLRARDNAYPCVVTIDEDNGRYMIRKSDSSGEVFNSPNDLVLWILDNWGAEDFIDPLEFESMLKEIQANFPISR
jgi:hypothetical protein